MVTRANKAIGLAIVRQIAKEGIIVVLTTHYVTRGMKAIESLKKQRFHNVNFHTLDLGRQVCQCTCRMVVHYLWKH